MKVFGKTLLFLLVASIFVTACGSSVASTSPVPEAELILSEAQNLEYIRKGEIVPPMGYVRSILANVPWEDWELVRDTRDTSECPDWSETSVAVARFPDKSEVWAELDANGIHLFDKEYGDLGVIPEGSIWWIKSGQESLVYLNCQNRFFFMWHFQP